MILLRIKRVSSVRAILLSFLIGILLLFEGHIYAEHVTIKTNRIVCDADENIIVSQCKQIWHRYKTSLSKGDIEGALKYVSDDSQESFRSALQSQRRAVHLGEIRLEEYVRNNIARFKMSVKFKLLPGDDIPPGYSVGDFIESKGYVVFIRNRAGEWKIDFY